MKKITTFLSDLGVIAIFGLSVWVMNANHSQLHKIFWGAVEEFSVIDAGKAPFDPVISIIFTLFFIITAVLSCVYINSAYTTHLTERAAAKANGVLNHYCWGIFSWSVLASMLGMLIPHWFGDQALRIFPHKFNSLVFSSLMAGIVILVNTTEIFLIFISVSITKRKATHFNTVEIKILNIVIGPLFFLGSMFLLYSTFASFATVGVIYIDPSCFFSQREAFVRIHLIGLMIFTPLAWITSRDHKSILAFLRLNLMFIPIPGFNSFRFGGGASGGGGAEI